jgi:hypothetical protein
LSTNILRSPGEPTPPVPGVLCASRAESRIGEGPPLVPHLLGMMISPLRMLALDSDVRPTPVTRTVAPLNTYTFLNFFFGFAVLQYHGASAHLARLARGATPAASELIIKMMRLRLLSLLICPLASGAFPIHRLCARVSKSLPQRAKAAAIATICSTSLLVAPGSISAAPPTLDIAIVEFTEVLTAWTGQYASRLL